MMYAVIMAGGTGTRLWPVSRKSRPKQVHPFLDGETLLKKTFRRLRRGIPSDRIFVTTGRSVAALVRRDLPAVPSKNFSIESVRRETAPAFGLAVKKIYDRDPRAVVVYVNADNFVKDERKFHAALRQAEMAVRKHPDHLALIGITPNYPDSGLGYIQIGRSVGRGVYRVKRFVEKPDAKTAARFVASRQYLWNPTLIVGRADHLLDLYRRHLPAVYALLDRPNQFHRMPRATIDYGILEKEKNMLVIPADFGWSDIGHWRTVHETLAKKSSDNVIRGRHVGVGSSGNLLFSLAGKLIATAGVRDLVVIDDHDVILIADKHRVHEVKQLVAELERKGLKKYL